MSQKSCDIFILCEPNLSSAPSSHNLLSGHLGKICLWLKSHLKLKKEKNIVTTFNYQHLLLLVLKFQISDCGKPGWMSEWVTGVCTAGNFFFSFQSFSFISYCTLDKTHQTLILQRRKNQSIIDFYSSQTLITFFARNVGNNKPWNVLIENRKHVI